MKTEMFDTFSHREKLIYCAALFDGEGTACICKEKSRTCRIDFQYRPTLLVIMADSGPVKQFHEYFGGSINIRNMKPPHKSCYYWQVSGRKAAQVAAQLLPFSRNDRKRGALKCVVDFGKSILPKTVTRNGVPLEIQQVRELLCKRCRAINARGSDANNQSPADLAVIESLKPDTTQLNLWD